MCTMCRVEYSTLNGVKKGTTAFARLFDVAVSLADYLNWKIMAKVFIQTQSIDQLKTVGLHQNFQVNSSLRRMDTICKQGWSFIERREIHTNCWLKS